MASSEKATVFASGYLIFRRSNSLQFLLMRHPDRWDLPKGHVDPGESIFDAAKRELWEETAIPFDALWTDPTFAFVSRYWVSKRKTPEQKSLKELTIYLGLLLRPIELVCTEHPDYRWWDWNPPHRIQAQSIDPLLSAVEVHLSAHRDVYDKLHNG